MNWHNIREWGVEGKGWTDTERYYDRLPLRVRETVPEEVWSLSHSATGMAALFESDAPEIRGRWRMESAAFNEPNFPAAGFSGLDLYTWTKKGWLWVGAGHEVQGASHEQALADRMEPKKRKFLLYLPLRNPVESVEIGVPDGATFTPIGPRTRKPVVFYGTSIVHGAYASRPGTIHPAILGRRLNRPTINLGFSGNARMESVMADLLAELTAKVYVLDCVPNMNADQVRERVVPFVLTLHKARPETPIVLVGERPYTNSWIRPSIRREEKERATEYRRAFKTLLGGVKHLYYIDGTNLFGNDHEAAADGSHPSDLGFRRMADILYPVLRKLC